MSNDSGASADDPAGEATTREPMPSRELIRTIAETVPVGLTLLDLDGRISMANARAELLLGRKREEITSRRFDDPLWRICACDGGPFPEQQLPFCRVVASGAAVFDVRHAIERPDGKRVFLSFDAAPLRDAGGTLTGVVAAFRDITELQRAREAQEAGERRYRSLFSAMQDAFSLHEIVCDDAGRPCDYRFIDVNPAFEKLTGIPANEWIGRRVTELLPETEPYWIELCGEVALTGVAKRFERYSQAFDRHYEVLAYSPQPGQFAALSTDITERKRAEERVLQRSRLDATATLAGGIAHDFNNLMVGVIGNAELARRGVAGPEELAERLDDIIKAAKRAGALAQQMLTFSRSGPHTPSPMRLEAAIDETRRLHSRSAPSRIETHATVAPDLWSVHADHSQMVQVILNLLINATEAMGGEGRITLEASNAELSTARRLGTTKLAAGRYVRLVVRDTGRGMDAKTRARLFEPFFSTKSDGRGLGLAAVHGIVVNHGGGIQVESEPGEGTTFRIYLPTSEADPGTEATTPGEPGGSETLLLIDDEPMVLHAIRRNLEALGYRVLVAAGGRQALDIATAHEGDIALAVLDLRMPDLPGREVFARLAEARPQTKVVLCSGHDIDDDAQRLLDAGACAFVRKPFLVEALARQLRAILDEQPAVGRGA